MLPLEDLVLVCAVVPFERVKPTGVCFPPVPLLAEELHIRLAKDYGFYVGNTLFLARSKDWHLLRQLKL